jgi:acyl-CoA dehydrogenase
MSEIARPRHYTAEHEMFRTSVRRFLEREVLPHREAWQAAGQVPVELWRRAGEQGFLCTKISPQYGGGGGDLIHCQVIIEEQTCGAFNELCFYLHSDIIAPYIELYGTSDQKQRFLPRMATGELVAAIAMTEPGAGSDLQAITTTARLEGDDYRLSGQKVFISNGQVANLIVVAAKTEGDDAAGISLFLVETDAPGFSRGRNLAKIGCKAQDSSELFFDNVLVARENLLGGEAGRGFKQLMLRLPEERLIMAMSAVAMMEEALEETITYVKDRQAFGQSVFDFQNTRFTLAEAKTETILARIFLNHCVDEFIDGRLANETAAMLKYWVTEKQFEVVDECLQLHGGWGYMLEFDIARRFLDSRLGRIAGGTNEIMKEIIARTL